MIDDREFRLLILGAGFSKPAGFPLGPELWTAVLGVIDAEFGRDNAVRHDLREFLDYKRDACGTELAESHVDFEEFIGFLDLEHYLGLRGSDTWSRDGNPSQLVLKWSIGKVLFECLENLSRLPDAYLRFAEKLCPGDIVLTFNYDTLLEVALALAGREFRLFPTRFSEIGLTANTVDSSHEEVVLLKLHGSIDWYDRTGYDERMEVSRGSQALTGHPYTPEDPIFGPGRVVQPTPLVHGPRNHDDPLSQIYRVLDPAPLYQRGHHRATPFLLSPSFNKLVYSTPLHSFWDGLGRAGAWQLGLGIIGFSLPNHDEYLRQVLYRLCRNYTESWWEEALAGRYKTPLRLVDQRVDAAGVDELRQRYRFLNWERTETHLTGFDLEAVEFMFAPSRRAR